MRSYFLCSRNVLFAFDSDCKSKPFTSGYKWDDDVYGIVMADADELEEFYDSFNERELEKYDIWYRECVYGTMSIDGLNVKKIKEKGLFVAIEEVTGLTTERNIAMVIYNLSQKYNCTPIQFINKINER